MQSPGTFKLSEGYNLFKLLGFCLMLKRIVYFDIDIRQLQSQTPDYTLFWQVLKSFDPITPVP